jgi:hypothetical protein
VCREKEMGIVGISVQDTVAMGEVSLPPWRCVWCKNGQENEFMSTNSREIPHEKIIQNNGGNTGVGDNTEGNS